MRLLAIVLMVGMLSLAEPGAASAGEQRIGAGTNRPYYNNWTPSWTYHCTSQGNFKVTSAKLLMFSNGGNRVKGFQFKYRVVPRGSVGPHWYSNWSGNVHTAFRKSSVRAIWMQAGGQGQSWATGTDRGWALQIKLKYPRSLRRAWRFNYQKAITDPNCGDGTAITMSRAQKS